MDYTKYFGIILSIAGSFLAFAYTTLRKHDLKMFIDKKMDNIYKCLNIEIFKSLAERQIEMNKLAADLMDANKKMISSCESYERLARSYKPQEVQLLVQETQDGLDDNRIKLIVGLSFCLIFIGYVLGKIDR